MKAWTAHLGVLREAVLKRVSSRRSVRESITKSPALSVRRSLKLPERESITDKFPRRVPGFFLFIFNKNPDIEFLYFFYRTSRAIIPYVVWTGRPATKYCKGATVMIVKLIVLAAAVLLVVYFVYRQSSGYVTVRYDLTTDKDIDAPVRFVMLSDLHDTDVTHDGNVRLVESIKALDPDFVILAGDMITSYMQPSYDPEITYDFLRKLSKEFTVYFGLGNHEQRYKAEPGRFPGKFEELLKVAGECSINVLSDSFADIEGRNVRIYGFDVPIENYRRVVTKKMPEEVVSTTFGGNADSRYYDILIAHDPDFFDEYVKFKPDLVLSGHLHGGIIAVPGIGGLISPQLKLFPKYYAGMFKKDDTSMIVSRGIGWHSMPVRIFNKAEILLIEITNNKGEK